MPRSLALHRRLRTGACFAAILAAGCGGGGGDSPPLPELLQITPTNQVAVAQAVAVNFTGLDTVRDVPAPLAADASPAKGAAAKRALDTAMGVSARALPLATTSITEPCPAGGSLAVTFDDRDNNATPSAGDVLTAVFNDCRDTDSVLITGGFAINIASSSESVFSGLFTFNQLKLTDADGSVSMGGQANFVYTDSRDAAGTWTTRVEMKVVAAGLVSSVTTPAYRETFTYDPEFAGLWNDVTPASAPGYSTAVLGGRMSVASLGKVVLATDPPLRDVWETGGLQSGAVLVTGFQSRLRVSVLNATTARLELDANNDGSFESTRDVPWSELLPF